MKDQHERYARNREREPALELPKRKQVVQTSRITIRLPMELRETADKLNLNMSEICRQALEKAVGKAKK